MKLRSADERPVDWREDFLCCEHLAAMTLIESKRAREAGELKTAKGVAACGECLEPPFAKAKGGRVPKVSIEREGRLQVFKVRI